MFEKLSTEIILQIFEYLSFNDIFYGFFDLNQRFQSILLQHQHFFSNFILPTDHFHFWQTILPNFNSQIKCLTLISPFHLPVVSLDLFSNLEILVIFCPFPIWYDEIVWIFDSQQFKKLTTFKIQSNIIGGEVKFSNIIKDESYSLKHFEHLSTDRSYSFGYQSQLRSTVNLQTLSLKLDVLNSLFDLFSLVQMPNLKKLNVIIVTPLFFKNQRYSELILSNTKLEKLAIRLEHTLGSKNGFCCFTRFIKQFSSSLISLSLDLCHINENSFLFDGSLLQQELLEAMIALKSFHFHVQLSNKDLDTEQFWSTFRTQFLFDHQWIFAVHGSHLYTLPYNFNEYKDFIDFNLIKSSDPLNSKCLKTWPNVKTIGLSSYFTYASDIFEKIKYRMPNLTSIIITHEQANNFHENQALDNILTISCLHGDPQILKRCAINAFPNTKHLILKRNHRIPVSSVTDTDRIRTCKIQHINMTLVGLQELDNNEQNEQRVLDLLKSCFDLFEDIQSVTIYFMRVFGSGSLPHPFADRNRICQLLNMSNFFELYQLVYSNDYLRLIKKMIIQDEE